MLKLQLRAFAPPTGLEIEKTLCTIDLGRRLQNEALAVDKMEGGERKMAQPRPQMSMINAEFDGAPLDVEAADAENRSVCLAAG